MTKTERCRLLVKQMGRAALIERLGVASSTVSTQINRGWLPARWYAVCDDLSGRAGIDCPRDLFSWQDTKPGGDGVTVANASKGEAQWAKKARKSVTR